jgi:hypothetical protein
MSATFDVQGQLRFDVSRGTAADSASKPVLVLPVSALTELLQNAGRKAAGQFGFAVGKGCGERAAARLGGDRGVASAAIEQVLTTLAGELCVVGMGRLSLERWGRAMVFVLSDCPIEDDGFVAQVCDGAVQACTGKAVSSVVLAREGATVRVLVTSEGAASRVRAALGAGEAWGSVIARVQTAGAS